ncbi:MAG: cytochrome PufQ [Pseudomonadota bacterium]
MTDQTTNMIMPPRERSKVAPLKREFYAYFVLIFLATLPLAILTWALTALRQFRLPQKDPISRAWSQARVITPMIFAA